MKILKGIAYAVLILYGIVLVSLYFLQTRLIFYPGRLSKEFKFKLGDHGEEVFITTQDGEQINALFFKGSGPDVILYFHGNAGDLSGWQFVQEDFTEHGYSILIIDFRGYGKSSGTISENGFYKDADAALAFLLKEKNYKPEDIIIYGRSIGTGPAVDLASCHQTKGLILESPYASLKKLANEKLPMLFPGLFLKYHFNNAEKIKKVKSPVVLIHGSQDTLIPPSHSEQLLKNIQSKKLMVLVPEGSHNDLSQFSEYQDFLKDTLPGFLE